MRKTLLLLVCATMLAGCAYAQSTPPMPGMEHHHHDDAAEGSEKLGQVSFPTSCAARSQAANGARYRFAALVRLYRGADAVFSHRQGRSCLRHGALGYCDDAVSGTVGPSRGCGSEAGRARDGQGARAGCAPASEHTARAGVHRRAERILRSRGCAVSAAGRCLRG